MFYFIFNFYVKIGVRGKKIHFAQYKNQCLWKVPTNYGISTSVYVQFLCVQMSECASSFKRFQQVVLKVLYFNPAHNKIRSH